jgi:PAT family beta-lactamase induction signal transducer AmpG
MVSAGFVAYLMSICDRRSVATQYAVLTALMALGGSVAGSLSGLLLARLDYAPYFALTVAAGLPGLALVPALRRGGAVSPAGG